MKVGRYKVEHLQTDLLIIGGGTAGCFAAVKAKEAAPELDVLILEKAHIEPKRLPGGRDECY